MFSVSPISQGLVFFKASGPDEELLERVQDLALQIPRGQDLADQISIDSQARVRHLVTGNNSPVVVRQFYSQRSYERALTASIEAMGTPHLENIRSAGELDEDLVIIFDDAGEDSLFDFVQNKRMLLEKEAVLLTLQMLECLQVLHNNKEIIHRNLKPEKVMVNFNENGLQFVLTDLRLAVKSSENPERCISGTPFYPSPEYALSMESSPYQDIWNLGYVIFSALSKEPLLYHFTNNPKNWRLRLLNEMQMVFGKFPQSMIKAASLYIRERYFNKKRSWIEPWKIKYELKEVNIVCENLERRIESFPEPIKDLLERIFSYEDRPTAQELLNLEDSVRNLLNQLSD